MGKSLEVPPGVTPSCRYLTGGLLTQQCSTVLSVEDGGELIEAKGPASPGHVDELAVRPVLAGNVPGTGVDHARGDTVVEIPAVRSFAVWAVCSLCSTCTPQAY